MCSDFLCSVSAHIRWRFCLFSERYLLSVIGGVRLSDLFSSRMDRRSYLIDVVGLAALAAVISIAFYHPFYFGDELTAFFRDPEARSFSNVFFDFNSYKPRLIFHALWAMYGVYDVPRIVPMAANLTFLWAGACVLYAIARNKLGASRLNSLLVAVVYMTGRFGLMLHFDYLSGNIETLSALLLFISIYFSFGFIGEQSGKLVHLFWVIIASVGMVLVHERYIVASLVLGMVMVLSALCSNKHSRAMFIAGIVIAIFPGGLFFLLGKLLASLAISTGTAGQPIAVSLDTVAIFFRYLANVLFGTNFGPPWFVGGLNVDEGVGEYLIPLMAASFVGAWGAVLVRRRQINWLRLLLLFGLAVALIVVAALPGADKQESRWMFPVFGLVCLVVVLVGNSRVASLFLLLSLMVNGAYYSTGSYRSIFNVEASTEAREFGKAFSRVDWIGKPGVLLNAPEPQASWWLGGDTILGNDGRTGLVFCRANFDIESACMYPPSAAADGIERFDFALKFEKRGSEDSLGPAFVLVEKDELVAGEKFNQRIVEAVRRDEMLSSATLSVKPSVVGTCEPGGSAENVSVQWVVANDAVRSVTIWLVPAAADPILFSVGGSNGTAETGKWVDSEISFVLMDSDTKKILGARTVRRRECN